MLRHLHRDYTEEHDASNRARDWDSDYHIVSGQVILLTIRDCADIYVRCWIRWIRLQK